MSGYVYAGFPSSVGVIINCLNITTNKQSMIYKDKKDIKDSE